MKKKQKYVCLLHKGCTVKYSGAGRGEAAATKSFDNSL